MDCIESPSYRPVFRQIWSKTLLYKILYPQDILEQPPLNLTPEELQEPRLDDIQEERSSQIAPGDIPDVENEQVLKRFDNFS